MAEKTPKTPIRHKRKIPPVTFEDCEECSPKDSLKFILGIETKEWELVSTKIGTYEGTKVSHFFIEYTGGPMTCPQCGQVMSVHDRKERTWRHANLDNTVCYLHAKVPRYQCKSCHTISQVSVPWADPNVSYSLRFKEVAIQLMANMSLQAASRTLLASWSTLDDIVGREVKEHLDSMDLSEVRRIRIDETSAKKRHRYITIITDADTNEIIYITKGKDSDTVVRFVEWLKDHKGNPANIEIVSSDFSDAFILGVKENLPNANNVFDLFHLIQLGNEKLDKDRSRNQVNGQRLKSVRYALLKKPENLTEADWAVLENISGDNLPLAKSYAMNLSLRNALESPVELARVHLTQWIKWVKNEGSDNFKALAKTVEKHFDGIIRALETGINNGYQESLNGRVQFSKRLANGYHKESRLGRIVYFRQFANKMFPKNEVWTS